MNKLLLSTFLLLLGTAWQAIAQEAPDPAGRPELITDRPDQTESAAIVPKGSVQLETGPYLILNDGNEREWSYNTLLARIGLLSWIELRLQGAYEGYRYEWEGGSASAKGLAPLIIGAKVKLLEEKGRVPQTALMYHITLPGTGGKSFQVDFAEHELRANFSHTLSDKLELAYNLGAQWQELKEADGMYTLSFAYDLGDKVGVFAEAFGFLIEDEQNKHSIDVGITLLARPNLQLDAYLGRGLTENANDWLFGGGFSWRIPR